MKTTEQYFPVLRFVMLYKVVPTFQSVDSTLTSDHSNESYCAVLACGYLAATEQYLLITYNRCKCEALFRVRRLWRGKIRSYYLVYFVCSPERPAPWCFGNSAWQKYHQNFLVHSQCERLQWKNHQVRGCFVPRKWRPKNVPDRREDTVKGYQWTGS